VKCFRQILTDLSNLLQWRHVEVMAYKTTGTDRPAAALIPEAATPLPAAAAE
jgi:hypothetical protein